MCLCTAAATAVSVHAAMALLPKVSSMLDKLAKTNVIHANKASNLKSGIANFVNKL